MIRISPDYNKTDELYFQHGELGYARSLKIIDGIVYIVNSSCGNFIEITDFNKKEYNILSTPHQDHPAGAYDKTGFVFNGLEKYKGYFYASNYFTKSWGGNADPDIKNWLDGKIEDVSHLIPKGQFPYYLKNRDDQYLLTTTFNHEYPCHNETAIIIQ